MVSEGGSAAEGAGMAQALLLWVAEGCQVERLGWARVL